jgi:hypothetical protein
MTHGDCKGEIYTNVRDRCKLDGLGWNAKNRLLACSMVLGYPSGTLVSGRVLGSS